MKALKSLSILSLALFLNGVLFFEVSAQDPKPDSVGTIKTAGIQDANKIDADAQTPVKRIEPRNDEKYRIGYQDTLEIQVARHPELSVMAINVGPDGTILMPRIDNPIVAVCKSERELKQDIETLYRSYLKNPFVNVRVADQRSQPVAVIGAVEKPGSFSLNRRVRLLELLAFAGGPKVEKYGSTVQVARVGNITGCANDESSDEIRFLSYKITDVQKGIENPWVEPGDIVTVLEADQAYVVGNIKEPTKFSLKDPVTLTQAIAIGGGLEAASDTNKVLIQRQDKNSPLKTELVFNLKDIYSKKIADPVLQANDIVEVPKNNAKVLRNGLLKALGGGLPGLFYGL